MGERPTSTEPSAAAPEPTDRTDTTGAIDVHRVPDFAPPHVEPVDLRDPAEAELAKRVAVAWRELRRGAAAAALRDHFLGAGPDAIEQGAMDALDVLVTRREWRMSDFADALRVDPSTATRSVQRLEKSGLAERRTCTDDGRAVFVRASRIGHRRHRIVSERRGAAMSRLLGGFDRQERRQLADLLERFVHELDALVTESIAPIDPDVTDMPGTPTGRTE